MDRAATRELYDTSGNGQAVAEGWDIFETKGSDHGPFQLQRDDEAEIFESDEAAWAFVVEKAQLGSAYHLGALEFLIERNPAEFNRLMDHCGVVCDRPAVPAQ